MRNTIIFAVVLSFFVAYVSKARVLDLVPEREYLLKVGETIKTEGYLGMEITLKDLKGVFVLSYPSQTKSSATIRVHTEGGCGPKSTVNNPAPLPARDSDKDARIPTPPCLGMPPFENEYSVSEGQTVMALGLKITVISITSDTLKIMVKVPGKEPMPTSTIASSPFPCQTPGMLQSSPSGVANPCPTSPVFTPFPIGGVVGGVGGMEGGTITICSAGSSGCNVCSGIECSPKMTKEGTTTETGQTESPRTLILPKNQEIQEVNRIEVKENNSVYKVKTKKKGRLLFLLPMRLETTYLVNSNSEAGTAVNVSRPWWSFLVR